MTSPHRGRPAVVLALLAILALAVGSTACSSPDENADGGGAPVVVNTPGGSVTIPKTPTRIAALGDQWTDAVASFGITPVAYGTTTKAQSGSDSPWTAGKLGTSTVIDLTGDRVSQIAAAKPDLILLPGFGVQPGELDKLKQIAPTIPSITNSQIDPWQDQVTLLGTVLRQPDKAKQIIAGVQQQIQAVKSSNPGLAGKTFTFAYLFSTEQIQVFGDPKDGAASLFTDLGLTIPRRLQDIAARQGSGRFPVSTENIPELNSDLLVVSASTPQLFEALGRLPGYQQLDSVRKKAVAELDQITITALNLPSALSIPYVLNKLEPALKAAAA